MGRYRTTLALTALLVLASVTAADDARDVLDRAIRAHGGADALARAANQVRASKGEIVTPAAAVPFTGEVTLRLPDRGRWSIDLQPDGGRARVQVGLSGERGWRSAGGAVKDLTPEEIRDYHEELVVAHLATLVPLKDDGYELTPLAAARVGDQAAAGIKAARKGQADVHFYFDPRTHLLLKVERRAKAGGLELLKEYYFGDYKDFNGVKAPTRIVETTNGRKTADTTVTGYRFPSRLDDAAFDRP